MSARSSVKPAVIMILEERERDKGNLMASGYTSRWEWQWIPCAPHPRQLSLMRVCILQTVLDPYKGANHLPLFAATSEVSFTIVCNRSKARKDDLPANVDVITVPGRIGPYYYGCADALFARSVLRRYPASDPFWKSFDVLHLNQVMGPAFRRLQGSGVPVLFTIHHPVTADREIALQESGSVQGILWP